MKVLQFTDSKRAVYNVTFTIEDKHVRYVARCDRTGGIIATVSTTSSGKINQLYVRDDMRRRGIARAMIYAIYQEHGGEGEGKLYPHLDPSEVESHIPFITKKSEGNNMRAFIASLAKSVKPKE